MRAPLSPPPPRRGLLAIVFGSRRAAGGEEAAADDRYAARRYAPRALRAPTPATPRAGTRAITSTGARSTTRTTTGEDNLRATTFERPSNERRGTTEGERRRGSARRWRRSDPEPLDPFSFADAFAEAGRPPAGLHAGARTRALGTPAIIRTRSGLKTNSAPPRERSTLVPIIGSATTTRTPPRFATWTPGRSSSCDVRARAFDRRLWSHYLRLCLLFACYRYRVAVWNAGSERVRDAASALERSGYSSVAARRQLVTSLAAGANATRVRDAPRPHPGKLPRPRVVRRARSRPYAFRALACGLVDENGGLVGASKTPAARARAWLTHAAVVAVSKMVMNAKMIRLSGATEVRVRATSALFMPSFAALHFIVVHGPFFVRHWAVGRARLLGAMRESDDDGGLGASDLDAMTKIG